MPKTRRAGRGLMASSLLVLSLASTSLLTASSAVAVDAPYGSCGAFQTIGVRGTGEAQPGGGLLPPLATQISSRTSRTILSYGLPYPATSDWANSVSAGTSMLASRMAVSNSYCPSQRFILIGYSQGAWVIGDALAGSGSGAAPTVGAALGSRVSAVILYGDPRFRAGESYNAGTFRAGVSGMIPRTQGALSAYASRIRSYCFADDPICQNGASGSGHSRYADVSTGDAASFAVSKMGG